MIADTCIEPIVFSFNWITQGVNKSFHIGVFFEISEELQQKENDGIIGEAGKTISVGDNGANKGEIYQGRDKSGKSATDPAVGMDFDVAVLVVVLRQPEESWLWPPARREPTPRRGRAGCSGN